MPKGILGVKLTLFKKGVLDILKGIFPSERETPKGQVGSAEHKIFSRSRAILYGNTARKPEAFLGKNVARGNDDVLTFTECLCAVKLGALYGDVFRIPKGSAAKGREGAFFYRDPLAMPKGIPQIEEAAKGRNIAALLAGTFPVCFAVKGAVCQ